MAYDAIASNNCDLFEISDDEIDQVGGGILLTAIAVMGFAAVMYQIGYSRGENRGESETCPA